MQPRDIKPPRQLSRVKTPAERPQRESVEAAEEHLEKARLDPQYILSISSSLRSRRIRV